MTPDSYIIVFDDDQGLCVPMGMAPDCEGAVESAGSDPIAIFPSRSAARRAITISTLHNRLLKAQGKIYNCDFIEARSCVKIRPCHTITTNDN